MEEGVSFLAHRLPAPRKYGDIKIAGIFLIFDHTSATILDRPVIQQISTIQYTGEARRHHSWSTSSDCWQLCGLANHGSQNRCHWLYWPSYGRRSARIFAVYRRQQRPYPKTALGQCGTFTHGALRISWDALAETFRRHQPDTCLH